MSTERIELHGPGHQRMQPIEAASHVHGEVHKYTRTLAGR